VAAGERLLREISRVGVLLLFPLAHAAEALGTHRSWFAFGFRNADDFARESLQRSGRWLRDLARLHAALEAFPPLAQALTGADGGQPIGPKAALCIARVAAHGDVSHWIAQARKLSLRALQRTISEQGAPPGAQESEAGPVKTERRVPVRLTGPPELKLAFEAVTSVHAAVVGRESGMEALVESMLGEAASTGWTPLDAFQSRLRQRFESLPRPSSPENRPVQWGRTSSTTKESTAFSPAMCAGQRTLDEFRLLHGLLTDLLLAMRSEGASLASLGELLVVFKGLIRLQDHLEIVLGELLLEMHERQAWRLLGFRGLETYAEACLGLGRSTARRRVSMARQLRRHSGARRAYMSGVLGEEAARWVVRRLEGGGEAHEEDVITHAASTSVKRLRDEETLIQREALLQQIETVQRQAARRAPAHTLPDDAAWHASLQRQAGGTRARIVELEHGLLERVVRGRPLLEVPLLLSLTPEIAAAFLACIEAVRRELCEVHSMSPVEESRARPSVRMARQFIERGEPVPSWLGLLAWLEECLWVWDEPRAMPRRGYDRVYRRDGYRCMAPGCIARVHLETHHVVYRSRGGVDTMENLLVLCRFHHQQGEHGTRARVRGKAPLGVTWRLGEAKLATWWRNERRLRPLT
jgi:5-methylcytosine-specific restriction endonuclease McrA